VLELRSADGKSERIDEIAADLVSRNPDVILASGGDFNAQALQRSTKSVPIVLRYSFDPQGTRVDDAAVAARARRRADRVDPTSTQFASSAQRAHEIGRGRRSKE